MKKKVTGIITITSRGTGYLASEELEEDVKIDSSLLNTALHGDEVEVVLFAKKKDEKQEGKVLEVLNRAKTRFVGVIDKKEGKNFAFLIADDPKMYKDIFIPSGDVENEQKVLVEMVEWSDSKKNPEGEIIKVIGNKGDNEAELHSIVLEKGLSIEFDRDVEKEAERVQNKPIDYNKRKDFREVITFTIDPEDAKDFDDALSVRKIEDGLYEVGVHIADVSHYVEENSKLDKEARKRAFSIYLVDRTIPMLPENLSNGICSLKPNEDRASFSAVFKIKEDGSIVDEWFGETVIHSDKRFTYKEAQNILDKKEGDFYEELSYLEKISKKLRKDRIDKGSLLIDDDEVFFHLDHDGRPLYVFTKEHLFTHNLIEEFMIIANKRISKKFNTLYRIHEKPDKDLINNLISFISNLGYTMNIKGKEISSAELNDLFDKIKGKDEEFLVKMAVLRSMSKAVYSIKNEKHFGLALDEYTHFTSPIRRYADLLMHRIVKEKLKGKSVNPKNYEKVAQEISRKELDVLDAERSSIAYKKVEYMMEKVGEEFDAIISGVISAGIFVQEVETKAEGMISISDMDDDYYVLDEENYMLIGTRKKKRYALGNKIRVKLVGGSFETRRLDFVLAK